MIIQKLFIPIFLIITAFASNLYALECNYGPECPDAAIKTPIEDPRNWVLQCVCNYYGPMGADPDSLTEFFKDIDYDGKPELFIGSSHLRGNAGGKYFVFKKKEDKQYYIGSLMLHPLAFISIPMDDDEAPKMNLYWRSNVNEGYLVTVKYLRDRFITTNKEKIYPNGKDKERYMKLFLK
jgi:hypothetical protein